MGGSALPEKFVASRVRREQLLEARCLIGSLERQVDQLREQALETRAQSRLA